MITAKKIRTLKERTKVRKCAEVFHLLAKEPMAEGYVQEILSLIEESGEVSEEAKAKVRTFYAHGPECYEDIYYLLLSELGESFADWDLRLPEGGLDASRRILLKHRLYLDGIRSPYNVGAIFRSAESFGVEKIYLSPGSASVRHERAERVSMGAIAAVDHEEAFLEDLPKMPIFSLEVGGKDLSRFSFPKEGICILGSEEGGVSKKALEAADRSLGRVSIPMLGAKGSINVSAAAAILLYKWMEYETT